MYKSIALNAISYYCRWKPDDEKGAALNGYCLCSPPPNRSTSATSNAPTGNDAIARRCLRSSRKSDKPRSLYVIKTEKYGKIEFVDM